MTENTCSCCGVYQACFSSAICCCCNDQLPMIPTYQIICLGITNSGKTTLLSVLLHENTDTIIPTVGFNVKEVKLGNATLNIKELGGGENIRQYWSRYYYGVEGVIFVIDGLCTHTELELTREELFKALENPNLRSLPWLILCNKQDVEGASTHQKVVEELKLDAFLSGDSNVIVKSCSKTNREQLLQHLENYSTALNRFYQERGDDVGARV